MTYHQQIPKRRCIKKINWFYVAAAIACTAGATMIGIATMGIGAPLMIGGLAFFMAGGALILFGSV
jgi:hypothetical protein